MLHCLWTQHRSEFHRRYTGHGQEIPEFWNGVRDNDPRIIHHPVIQHANYKTRAIRHRALVAQVEWYRSPLKW
eukprot:10805042-Karenia_brevis.AAC.1